MKSLTSYDLLTLSNGHVKGHQPLTYQAVTIMFNGEYRSQRRSIITEDVTATSGKLAALTLLDRFVSARFGDVSQMLLDEFLKHYFLNARPSLFENAIHCII